MAKPAPGPIQDALFMTFLAPLVVGGEMHLHKPIGGAIALAMEGDRPFPDPELGSHVQLARVRVARALAPVDRFEAITSSEWALTAILNDLIQSTHPGFDAVLRRGAPAKLLAVLDDTLSLVPSPSTVGDALSRHTLFSRIFEVTRTDVSLAWWTGKALFLGEEPPARLKAWPEIRRVVETRLPRPLVELPTSGGVAPHSTFLLTLAKLLSKSPLTDFATIDRKEPIFQWSAPTLGLVSARNGRTLALRAMQDLPEEAVDEALGIATKVLVEAKAWQPLGIALDLLGERMLTRAVKIAGRGGDATPIPEDRAGTPSGFSRSAGAFAAQRIVATTGAGLGAEDRARVLSLLGPAAGSGAGLALSQLLGG